MKNKPPYVNLVKTAALSLHLIIALCVVAAGTSICFMMCKRTKSPLVKRALIYSIGEKQ